MTYTQSEMEKMYPSEDKSKAKTPLSLPEKLMLIQSELKAPKGQYNSFGKYKYRSAEDILESVKPYFAKYRVMVILNDNIETIGEELTEDTKTLRTYVKATATLYDLDSNMNVSTSAYARESDKKAGMDYSQITGTASSYARKYALNGLFCIDDTKDADTDEFAKQTKQKSPTDYLADIKNCETETEINNLFYEWSKVYKKGTAEYKLLTTASFDRKKQIIGD